jgi:hypothetical protein
MTNAIHTTDIEVSVLHSSDVVSADVRDRRLECIALFDELTPGQRDRLAEDAWRVGLHAIQNARAAAQESRLQEIGTALVGDIDRQLRDHVEGQQKTIAAVMARYFDPNDGQVTQRLASFVADEGVLARLLDGYLAPQNSVLAQALAHQVGENSPLFKKLSPTDSEGLVKILEAQLRSVMHEGHAELVNALDPLAEDGAVARFLRTLRDELKGADEDRAKQLSTALAALDANDEDSLLSRLVRETHRARQDVLNAINPDAPQSPMAILKTSLTALLKEQAAAQSEVALRQETRQTAFETEVRVALGRLEAKRAQDQRSPGGGFDFEDAVVGFLTEATRGAPCLIDETGSTAGLLGRSKKGDAVLRFTEDSAFVGASVVFEAKRDASYTPQRALDELDEARKNRGALAGVFVMARSHASPSFLPFARYGNNVIVTWDDQDPATNSYLHAALLLGMALVTRAKSVGDAGDVRALQDIEARIDAELERLAKMEGFSKTIGDNAERINEEIRKSRRALDLLVGKAQSTLRALNVELHDEDAERASPIGLPRESLESAVAALSAAPEIG